MDAPRPPRAALAGYAAVLAVSTVVSAGWLGVGAVVAAVRYWPAAARLVQQDPDGTWARAVLAAAPASEPAGQALLDYALSGLSLGLAVVLVALGPRTWSIRLLVIALVGSAGAFNLQAHAAARTIEEATGLAVGQIHQVVLHGVACAAYILALLVFPTPSWNRVPGLGRTRRVLAVVGVATLAVVGVGTALLPHTSSCVLFFGFLVPVVGLAVLPHRVRHGHTAAVRIQARLLFSVLVASVALAVVLAAVTALLAGMGEQPALTLMDPTAPASAAGGEPIALLFWFSRLAAVAIAAAVLVATRRRDLWAAERVFSRGLAVALVAGLVGGGFVTLRALLAAALDPRPAAALAAAVAALGFLPLYVRAEWAVDRLLYGTRPTPYRALAEVAALSRGAPGDRLDLARVAEAVGRGLGATTCRMTVVRPGLRDRTYTWTEADGEVPEGTELVEVPIRHGEDHIGTIAVDRGAVAGLQDQRHHLLEDVAASLGVVVQASRAGIELERQLRAALAHAEEIAVSRRQAVAEMDNERRRIERDLHDGAQHHLVSLGLTLGLIEHQLERGQVAEARAWLAKLVTQMGTAEAVLAETTAGVSSAVLTGQGLAAALRADLEGAPVPATLETDGIGPDRRFPPEIEAAVYFCCAEAVGNARKHAPAATVSVRLAERDGILTFDVRDDGPGFAVPDVRVGTAASGTGGSPRRSRGIANIATRIAAVNGTVTLRSTPGGGTVVAGSVPVPTEAPPGDTGRTAPIPVPPRPAAPPPAVPPAAPRPPAPLPGAPTPPRAPTPPGATTLAGQVRDLMALARAAYPDGAGREPLGALARRLGEPVRIAVLGPAESGVSTLVAALVGGEVPRSGPAGPPVPVWFRHGDAARTAMTPEGRLVVLPAVALQRMTLIDLPTVGADPGSAAAAALLDAGRTGGPAFDALVLLLRGEADARPLRRVLPAGRSAHHPGTTVGVLAAVEVSCDGGADPAGAREAAIRLGMSSEVRPLCRTVVAVSGLLAAAAVTLRQNEFDLLREVATWPADELDHRVTAPGAFAEGPGGGDGAGPARRALLHRFGPLGVRTAAEALRTGVVSGPAGVAGVLLTASGLTRLQELLTTRVLARADTLRARSVLIGLEVLVRAAPPAGAAGERLLYQVERVRAGAHELTELDLVDELWTSARPPSGCSERTARSCICAWGWRPTPPPTSCVASRRCSLGDGGSGPCTPPRRSGRATWRRCWSGRASGCWRLPPRAEWVWSEMTSGFREMRRMLNAGRRRRTVPIRDVRRVTAAHATRAGGLA